MFQSNNPSHSQSVILLFLLFLLTLLFSTPTPIFSYEFKTFQNTNSTNTAANYTITSDFANAIDFAIGKLTTDTEFQQGMTDLGMIFTTPGCTVLPYTRQALPSAPASFSLPRSGSPLILCYEIDALLNWPKVHELAGRMLMKILNAQYQKDIPYTFLKVNTTALGYFNTLKSMVDSGSCDIAIASTNLDTDRLSKVHFNCPYGSSSPGYLRSSLDNETIIINQESDINSENVTILTYRGSSYDTYAKATFKKAKLVSVSSGYTECFNMILKKQAHILLGDATDLATWLKANRDGCGESCFSRIYGQPFSFGSFITNNIRESNSNMVISSFSLYSLLIVVFMAIFISL